MPLDTCFKSRDDVLALQLKVQESEPPAAKSGPSKAGTVALMVIALILLGSLAFYGPKVSSALNSVPGVISKLDSYFTVNTAGSDITAHSYSPLIGNGSADILYPPDYDTLAAYALQLINWDRANFSAGPVTLANNSAGQQHADSMLRYGYFSHWDTQGYKPYMRYTLLGGTGADFENIAYIYDSGASYNTVSVEAAIKSLEYDMMYNDQTCCNNGHKDNIINPLHDQVSIGIAYNATTIYFDEEFQSTYIANFNLSISNSNYVTITGVPTNPSVTDNVSAIYITYDSTPQAETPSQLNSGPTEYDPGTIVGGVLPPMVLGSCGMFETGTTVCAGTWTFTQSEVDVGFSLNPFINQNGAGVYTIYMVTGQSTDTAITTLSLFIN